MKPKDFLNNVFTSKSSGRRNDGFLRVSSTECLHSPVELDTRSNHVSPETRRWQRPIELKRFQPKMDPTNLDENIHRAAAQGTWDTTLTTLNDGAEMNSVQHADNVPKNTFNVGKEPAFSGTRFEDNLQVYNSPSEELPNIEEETLPLAFSEARLAFRDMISGNEHTGHERSNMTRGEGGDRPTSFRGLISGFRKIRSCGCCSIQPNLRNLFLITLLVALLLLSFGCVLIIIKRLNFKADETDTDFNKDSDDKNSQRMLQIDESEYMLKFLRQLTWPLADYDSRKHNISFDPILKEHERWNFDQTIGDSHSTTVRSTGLGPKYVVLPPNPNQPSIDGYFVDPNIFNESKHIGENMLEPEQLNQTSFTLETLLWKGLAGNVAVIELKSRLPSNFSTSKAMLKGHLPNTLCYKEDMPSTCDKTLWFRSIDGKCNNVINPSWGSQYSPYRRILDPSNHWYSYAKTRAKIPNPNIVSKNVHSESPQTDSQSSAFLPLWAMFIFHDIVKTATSPVNCCQEHSNKMPFVNTNLNNNSSPVCNLKISKHYTNQFKCAFSIPTPATYPSCELEPRSSFNLETSYIDGSNIYGSSIEVAHNLRLKKFGELKEHYINHDLGFLPLSEDLNITTACRNHQKNEKSRCFVAGDTDVNQLASLTSLNTIFMRHHNNIAGKLKQLNPPWDDEKLFEESRRIVIAQIQHITYNEFLPIILGEDVMQLSGLNLTTQGYYELYNAEVNPSVSSAVAGALAYFWYPMMNDKIKVLFNATTLKAVDVKMSSLIRHPEYLTLSQENLQGLLKGLSITKSNLVGVESLSELRSLESTSLNNEYFDTVSMIIQLGRDLNLPSYTAWRKLCGFPDVTSFQNLEKYWYPDAYERIASTYTNLEEIDLFTGMLAEKHLNSAKVGPVMSCLLADQFLRLRQGDRFWYENELEFHHFTEDQLKAIRQTRLSTIICDNTRDYGKIQQLVMQLPSSSSNKIFSCTDTKRPKFPFQYWEERSRNNQNKIYVMPHQTRREEASITRTSKILAKTIHKTKIAGGFINNLIHIP